MRGQMQIGKGKYFLSDVIASGTYGKVYANYPYAIKQLRMSGEGGKKVEKIRRMLMNEIEILKELRHQNVVRLHEIIEERQFLYLVMEYCEGDLKMLRKNMAFGEQRAMEVMEQVVAGCREMASHNVVHRDLKPANILHSAGVFKIADFGMSRYVQAEEPLLQSHVGTPFYMAPQILQHKVYTRKCDIWSLGVILYEMIYGRLPWEGKNEMLLLANILSRPLSFPHRLTDSTYHLLRRMLCISEDKRISWQELFQHFSLAANKRISTLPKTFPANLVARMLTHERETFSLHSYNTTYYLLTPQQKLSVYQYVKTLIREQDYHMLQQVTSLAL